MRKPPGARNKWATRAAFVVVTALSLWVTATRLAVSSDLTSLFPTSSGAAMLARYVRTFGGGDAATLLVRAGDPDEATRAAADAATALRGAPSVLDVIERLPSPDGRADANANPSPNPNPNAAQDAAAIADFTDPSLAWRAAGPRARERLARALTDEGMQTRLDETHALLQAPALGDAEDWLARDPLRLTELAWSDKIAPAGGLSELTADGGRARLVVVRTRGHALDGAVATAFADEVERVLAPVRAAHPAARIDVTGGYAIAAATERMMKRDLALSGTLALVLAAITFVATFGRVRALAAVLPPLALGTLWTTGIAAAVIPKLSPIAVAFTAVVVGVGVDTGVHVYAALLDARRAGLSPGRAAARARAETARPVLLAAVVAGLAFGALGASSLPAMRQLGLLCGAGEVLTAVAIVVMTPEIGAWIERGTAPAWRAPRWLDRVYAATATRARAAGVLGLAAASVVAIAVVGWPPADKAVVAIRPRGLAPITAQDDVNRLFGGRPGQWIVVSEAATAEEAEARADAIAEALEPVAARGDVEGFDALTPFAPAAATQRARLAARDALDLPGASARLATALARAGFDVDACRAGIDALAHPSHAVAPIPTPETAGARAWLLARYLAREVVDGTSMHSAPFLAATYVRPTGDAERDARAVAAIHAADPDAVVTGWSALEDALRASLRHDLPRLGALALAFVVVGLGVALRRARDVAIALAALAFELALVGLAMRAFGVRWHVYDALILPVLVGITIDESMFLLAASRRPTADGARDGDDVPGRDGDDDGADPARRALVHQGGAVVATALTTAAGFAALLVCRFDGLFDVGAVGAIGTLAGLAAALFVVPAALRVARGSTRSA